MFKRIIARLDAKEDKLIKGIIKPELDFSYVLDLEEIERGVGLACQTSLRSDIQVKVKLLK